MSEETKLKLMEFTNRILHGTEDHRKWLLDAVKAYINGTQIPMMKA